MFMLFAVLVIGQDCQGFSCGLVACQDGQGQVVDPGVNGIDFDHDAHERDSGHWVNLVKVMQSVRQFNGDACAFRNGFLFCDLIQLAFNQAFLVTHRGGVLEFTGRHLGGDQMRGSSKIAWISSSTAGRSNRFICPLSWLS